MKVYGEGVSWLDTDTKHHCRKMENILMRIHPRIYERKYRRNTNHVVELEVMGETGDVVIKDEEAPTVPGNLRVVSPKASEAEIRFLPSVDNTGVENTK